MERVKRALDECYPEFRHLTMQCLQNNTGWFKKDSNITKLILVQNREGATEQLIKTPNKRANRSDNNEEIERIGKRPGRENYDIMEENSRNLKSKDKGGRWGAEKAVLSTNGQSNEDKQKWHWGKSKRARLMKVKLSEEIKQCQQDNDKPPTR